MEFSELCVRKSIHVQSYAYVKTEKQKKINTLNTLIEHFWTLKREKKCIKIKKRNCFYITLFGVNGRINSRKNPEIKKEMFLFIRKCFFTVRLLVATKYKV